MRVQEIMTKDPACCTPDARLQDVARMMLERDCGEIPIVESESSRRPIGVVTDRDLAMRVIARDRDPGEMTAADCMSSPAVTVSPETDIDRCCRMLEEHRVRRMPVVDDRGECCGIISQADIARNLPERQTAQVVRTISEPGATSTRRPIQT